MRHLVALYDAVESHVTDRRAEFLTLPDEASRIGGIIEMRSLVRWAQELQSSLTWVDAITNPPIDLGTKYFIELAARRLVTADVDLVLVPAADSSYATYSDPYRNIISDWGDPSKIEGDRVTIVFLPRREQRSALLHPLILHELGHAVCRDHGLTKSALEKAMKRKRLLKRFGQASAEVKSRDNVVDQEAALTVIAGLRSWTEEALCDAIASFYLGPTYLYSFVVEVLGGNIDRAGSTHPPPRKRIALMLDHLDSLGWAPVMSRYAGPLDEWLRHSVSNGPTYSEERDFLVWMLDATAGDVRRLVGGQLGSHSLAPDEAVLEEIDELLDAGIPPAQSRKGAIDPRAVSLGCWLHALQDAGGDIASLPRAADAKGIEGLLSKGLEMAALVNAWD
jgi:hypothetical protein